MKRMLAETCSAVNEGRRAGSMDKAKNNPLDCKNFRVPEDRRAASIKVFMGRLGSRIVPPRMYRRYRGTNLPDHARRPRSKRRRTVELSRARLEFLRSDTAWSAKLFGGPGFAPTAPERATG